MPKPPLNYQSPMPPVDRRLKRKVDIASIGVGVVVGGLLTVPAIFLAVMSAGAGHGDYFAARLIFPYPFLLTPLTGNTIAAPSMTLAFLQMPIEGALLGFTISSSRWLYVLAVVGSHLLAFGLTLGISNFN
jgi:hypothetical protein